MTLNDARRGQILEILNESAEVRVARLAEQLRVSEMTVRRDLKALEDQGALKRVYGGAVNARAAPLPPVARREPLRGAEKVAIARLAARLVEPGASVFIGGSSTTAHLADELARGPQASVSTQSIAVAQRLAAGVQQDVRLFGGILRPDAGVLIGSEMIELLERRVFDVAFFGIVAVDARFGFLDPTEWHVHLKRAVRRRARRLVIVADHTKFAARSDFCALEFDAVDTLVTDRPPPEDCARALVDAGVRVIAGTA